MTIRRLAAALIIGAAMVLSGCGGGGGDGSSSDIAIGNARVAAESNTIRIGTPTIHLPRRTKR